MSRSYYYARDPHWIRARYPSTCAKCGGTIVRGSRAFWWPNGKFLECAACGEVSSRKFESEAFDEYVMGGM